MLSLVPLGYSAAKLGARALNSSPMSNVYGPDGGYYYRKDGSNLAYMVPARQKGWTPVDPASAPGQAILAKIPTLSRLSQAQANALDQAVGQVSWLRTITPVLPLPRVVVPSPADEEASPSRESGSGIGMQLLGRPLIALGVPALVLLVVIVVGSRPRRGDAR